MEPRPFLYTSFHFVAFSIDSFSTLPVTVETEFITELNEAITEGIPSPKSKRTDLVKRLAVSLHVFTHIISDLVEGRKLRSLSKEVTLDTVKKSLLVLDYCHRNKLLLR